jgi:cytochrome P450
VSYRVVREPGEVREVLRRVEDFVPTNALTSVVPLSPATLRRLARVRFALPAVLASATGTQHRDVRRLVAGFFTPEKVAALRPRVVELADERCAVAAVGLEQGSVDLADVIAQHVPPVIMAELTGIGCPELPVLKRWSRDSLELFWGWPDPDRQLELADSAAEFYLWLRETVLASSGGTNLFGLLRDAGMSVADCCSLGYFLVVAGQETTSQLINTAFYRALADPDRWPMLADQGEATAFVQGVLATESSVHTWRRSAARATELAGVPVPAGAEILLELSGYHPPDAPPTAYALAFGHGLHRCLGARLAELEAVAVLQETARALPDLMRAGSEPAWLRLLSFQAPLSVCARRRTG